MYVHTNVLQCLLSIMYSSIINAIFSYLTLMILMYVGMYSI